uniref:Uncharacterized protein n=1 Tax=Myotis myotis TaxID=51298 RepID=A0A7J7T5S9_MYOMY|nr:hypothetical protein mMyoMyo1_009154 [Myotis myotis]
MVSLLMFRATYGPVLGQGSCLTICCFQKGPRPQRSPECCLHSLLTQMLQAGQRRGWFLSQRLSLAKFGRNHRKPIHSFKMLPQTSFESVGLPTCLTSLILNPVPDEGLRRCGNVPPPAQGCFLPWPDQTPLTSPPDDTAQF